MIYFRWIYVTFLYILVHSCCSRYVTHYVESECSIKGTISLRLTEEGESSAIILKATSNTSYSLRMRCNVSFSAPPSFHVLVTIKFVDFKKNPFNESCTDYIEIVEPMCHNIPENEMHQYRSEDHMMTMLYITTSDKLDNRTLSGCSGFELTTTAFYKHDHDGICSKTNDSFECHNGNCIWSGLQCDGHNNCGDFSDEIDCDKKGSSTKVLIILGLLILFLLIIMGVATLLCSKNESLRRLSTNFTTRLRSRTISVMPTFSRK